MDFVTVVGMVVEAVTSLYRLIPFTGATWFVLGVLGFFVWLFIKAHRDPNSPVDWEDLLLDPVTQKVTPYKLGYLIGVILGTWVIVRYADAGKLSWDIFGGYLMYLLGGAGWAGGLSGKPAPTPPVPTPAPTHTDPVL